MNPKNKKYKFFIAETGEVIETITLKADEFDLDDKLDKIRQKLALDKGFEVNDIDYEEEI
jgi:hypothetical protein